MLFSFVLLAIRLVTSLRDGTPAADVAAGNGAFSGQDTNGPSRVECGSTEIGGTATDTSLSQKVIVA